MTLALRAPLAVSLTSTFVLVVGGCNPLDDKHVAVAPTRGVEAAIAGLIDTPLFQAADAFGTKNSVKISKSTGAACATDGCEIQRAKEAKQGAVLTSEAQNGVLVVKLLNTKDETVVGEERVAPNPATIHVDLPSAVTRLLAKKYGGEAPAPAAPTETAPQIVETKPVVEDAEPADKKAPVKNASLKPRGPKPEAGRELRRGDSMMALDGNDQVGDPGTLILTTDAITWLPGQFNVGGRRQSFKLDDVKRVSIERGNLVVHVTWGPKYVFETKQNPGQWQKQIEDARYQWTGKAPQ